MSVSKSMILGAGGATLTADEISLYRDERPWGFILFARNCIELPQIADLVAAMRDAVGRPDAPVLIDQEGGRVQRIRPPMIERYPSATALGEIYRQDREKGLRAAWLMSRLHAFDLMKLGVTVDCLPVLDVPVEGASNVIGDRAYGFDPQTVASMGKAAAEGLKAGGMLPIMKHMPGHGRGMADSHHELPVVTASRAELEGHDFVPFVAMKDELMAMSAHIVFTAYDDRDPATISPVVIEDVIRGHIGFDGLLVSDDTSMNALKGTIGERAARIMGGGCDIVLHCNGLMDEMKAVVKEVVPLSGKALQRAEAVERGFAAPDASDEQALRAEFHEMMAVA
ncbi:MULTISPECIES: beta-N-acetylhexosaminidase [Rhizobiaceae]|jgi:beta-N-acetylhexosaminidase|uniref:beta-N-acetylhexosaminidase n=1 Tax=Aliirhizobium cellulosilyticum TaxID=393664 RepID=A0A7W4SVW7_9HYPH|nr:beta-N-acetylhexosaminidase [Rhizobium cellulosilyticum]MBB4347901.1 beta-N-acetylhexosaminidase [Rhizobium cellulosilyticum]MBB4409705.1 beta-N-acetylhexosaminidase [Rhizobium cellulosilyticum]MBB4444392.1 beta-N-acetylhexosaminidase [Rhizobium cellulosilyticum]